MGVYKELILEKVNRLRSDYNVGNYCGRNLFSIIEKVKLETTNNIHLFRLPFKENNVAGFIGYKNNQFIIFTNTNKNLGYEVFTLAHEIYHLLENERRIKDEVLLDESEDIRDKSDDLADLFAAELLMPQKSVIDDYNRLMGESELGVPDYKIVIELQQEYYVEYKAITKRLKKLELIDKRIESSLNEMLENNKAYHDLTKKLGFTNELNEPSESVHLPRRFLKAIEENYENNDINYDDLSVIFDYCNKTPEDFGYEEDESLSDNALSLLDKLKKQLGSD